MWHEFCFGASKPDLKRGLHQHRHCYYAGATQANFSFSFCQIDQFHARPQLSSLVLSQRERSSAVSHFNHSYRNGIGSITIRTLNMQLYNDEISFPQKRNARSNAKKIDRCKTSGSGSSIGLSEETYNQECILRRDGYSIRSVNSSLHRSAVSALLQRMYSWRGYDTSSEEMFVNNSNWMTFEVSSQQQLVGTLTLGIDGEEGLLADKLHKDEINNFRKKRERYANCQNLPLIPCMDQRKYSPRYFTCPIFTRAVCIMRMTHLSKLIRAMRVFTNGCWGFARLAELVLANASMRLLY